MRRLGVAALPAVYMFLASCASNAPQDTLAPDGPIADKQNNLFLFVFVIAAVVFVLVQGLLIATVIRHRHRPGRPDPIQVHGNTKLEIGWTVVPALLLVGVAFPTVFAIFDVAREPKKNVLPVEVYGHLWWWEYRYPTLGVSTANELHIPINTDVRLSLHSIEPGLPAPKGEEFAAGVIHSFWIPKLAGKQDVVPGRVNKLTIRADKVGEYYGQCAEYCNLSHANMRLRAYSMEQAKFDEWVAHQRSPIQTPTDPEAAKGFELFKGKGTCIACHTLGGVEGAVARVGPNLTHLMDRKTFAGATFDISTDNLRDWIRDPSAMKPMRPEKGTGMPKVPLSETEINQLVAFLETLK
ncbi:MAG: cytochrome c oxidase subunit II [Acidimicrobiia bacterium]